MTSYESELAYLLTQYPEYQGATPPVTPGPRECTVVHYSSLSQSMVHSLLVSKQCGACLKTRTLLGHTLNRLTRSLREQYQETVF